jgi:hypothetical protein
MKQVGVLALFVAAVLASPVGLRAQAPRSDVYDMATSTTLKGTVSAILLPTGAPVFLLLDVSGRSGQREQWAIEGDLPNKLIAAGWRPRMGTPVAVGNVIDVVVYRVKAGMDPMTLVPASEAALVASAKARRVAYGTEITLPGGKTVTFGGNK